MRFQLFYEVDSFLHRVNPLTKLVLTIIVMVVLTLIVDPLTPLAVALLGLSAIVLFGRVPLGQAARTLRPFLAVSFGLFWTTALFYASDPTTLLQALVQRARLSPRFGYGMIAAYRFVPLFDGELASIRAAHRVRGVASGGGPAAQYRRLVGHMVPLLAGGIRHAERVALAMDARGFGASSNRTYYRQSTFGWRDVLFAAGAAVILATLLVAFHTAGWLGESIPPFLR